MVINFLQPNAATDRCCATIYPSAGSSLLTLCSEHPYLTRLTSKIQRWRFLSWFELTRLNRILIAIQTWGNWISALMSQAIETWDSSATQQFQEPICHIYTNYRMSQYDKRTRFIAFLGDPINSKLKSAIDRSKHNRTVVMILNYD